MGYLLWRFWRGKAVLESRDGRVCFLAPCPKKHQYTRVLLYKQPGLFILMCTFNANGFVLVQEGHLQQIVGSVAVQRVMWLFPSPYTQWMGSIPLHKCQILPIQNSSNAALGASVDRFQSRNCGLKLQGALERRPEELEGGVGPKRAIGDGYRWDCGGVDIIAKGEVVTNAQKRYSD